MNFLMCAVWLCVFVAWDLYQSKYVSVDRCLQQGGASQRFIISTATFILAFIVIAIKSGKAWRLATSSMEEAAMLWVVFGLFIAAHGALSTRGWRLFHSADQKSFLANPDKFLVQNKHFLSNDFKRRWREAGSWLAMRQ